MSIREKAQADWQRIISDPNQWGEAIHLEAPNLETADIFGLVTKHHINYDTEGNLVNTKNVHISFSEKHLVDLFPAYPLRDANLEVDLKNHKVTAKDSTGVDKNYIIRERFPNETVGVITCILGDFV